MPSYASTTSTSEASDALDSTNLRPLRAEIGERVRLSLNTHEISDLFSGALCVLNRPFWLIGVRATVSMELDASLSIRPPQ
jgi:hypothetical protein